MHRCEARLLRGKELETLSNKLHALTKKESEWQGRTIDLEKDIRRKVNQNILVTLKLN